MNAVGTVQFPAAPPAARAQKIFHADLLFVFENNKPPVRHLDFERLEHLGWGSFLLG